MIALLIFVAFLLLAAFSFFMATNTPMVVFVPLFWGALVGALVTLLIAAFF